MKNIFLIISLFTYSLSLFAQDWTLLSPNERIKIEIKQQNTDVAYRVLFDQKVICGWNSINIVQMNDKKAFSGKMSNTQTNHIDQNIESPFYRQKSFRFEANTAIFKLNKGYKVEFCATNEGIAYRFLVENNGEEPIFIKEEKAEFNFAQNTNAWLAYTTNTDNPFAMAFQNVYDNTTIENAKDKLAFLPATFSCGDVKLTIAESNLEAYPGMFVEKNGNASLKGTFAPYPAQTDYYQWRHMLHVSKTTNYIAKIECSRALPWRILAIAESDVQMPTNNLVYALASPNRIGNTDWIETGKVAWDWWNDWNLHGVDFEAGINMPTYKYYIDFASKNGLQFVILDEGWYDSQKGDMLTTIPEIDLPELISYAKEKNVKIILWTVFNVLDEQLETACPKYSQMGIAGFKVDFLDRDDQTAVEMAYRIAEVCAKHHLTLDMHGFYKPTGLNRTFPNIINFESVFGMEEMKWSDNTVDMPLYDVTFPYIRMMCGAVDYTPGAMHNATRNNWRAVYSEPMSMGTRAHQVAAYIVHDSPLTMLADAPTNYEKEQPTLSFIANIPTVFDNTQIIDGIMGLYIITLRRKNDTFYIGGQTNWDERNIEIDLSSILPSNVQYKATLYIDGINSNRKATDYTIKTINCSNQSKLKIHMASGGGFAIKLEKL